MKFDFDKIAKAAALGVLVCAGLPCSSEAAVVINEAYVVGGSTSAGIKTDFIELYNNGSSAVDLTGLYLQYASAAGSFVSSATSVQNAALNTFSLAAGAYYVVTGLGSSLSGSGSTINSDQTSSLSLSGASGKVRLTSALGADGNVTSSASVLDFLGYGTANAFEGSTGPSGVTNFLSSFQRVVDGADSNNNNADFGVKAYTPGGTNVVPEPASLGLVAVGAVLALRRSRAK